MVWAGIGVTWWLGGGYRFRGETSEMLIGHLLIVRKVALIFAEEDPASIRRRCRRSNPKRIFRNRSTADGKSHFFRSTTSANTTGRQNKWYGSLILHSPPISSPCRS